MLYFVPPKYHEQLFLHEFAHAISLHEMSTPHIHLANSYLFLEIQIKRNLLVKPSLTPYYRKSLPLCFIIPLLRPNRLVKLSKDYPHRL